MFDKLKKLLQSPNPNRPSTAVAANQTDAPEIPLIAPADNSWGVPLLDVSPVTQTYISASSNPEMAKNSVSYNQEDGLTFSHDTLASEPEISADLGYRIDRMLAPGAMFIPRDMDYKWALFFHNNRIICVRSWLRKTVAIGEVEFAKDIAIVTKIRGALTGDKEEPDFLRRAFDFLIRSHALGEVFPAPLPPGLDKDPQNAASWCFSLFGRPARVATAQKFERALPERPLRTHSMLHIAVARGDTAEVQARLQSGIPIDLIAADTLAPLHWALARPDTQMLELLLNLGSPIDVRSTQGATPLMTACQSGSLDKIAFLLNHGADPNAVDNRGFTALHRAAEAGHSEIVRLLLAHGAKPSVEAQSHTPLSLAEKRGHKEIIEILRAAK